MKINGYLPGGIRPENLKNTPKKEKADSKQESGVIRYRGAPYDEYIKENRGIMPKLYQHIHGKSGVRNAAEQDGGAESLDGAVKQIAPQIGDAPERVEQADRTSAAFTSQFVSITATMRSGFQSEYAVTDAAATLWRQEYTVINFNDPSSLEKLRDRLRAGNYSMDPTAEELSAYTEQLRQNGLETSVNWSALGQDLGSFTDIQPNDLADSLDYLASRFVAVMDQLGRNFSGGELEAEQTKLGFIWQSSAGKLIENYTASLQKALGISNEEAQGIRDSFDTLFSVRAEAYAAVLGQVRQDATQNHPQDAWLQNHDAYIAARLREAAGTADDAASRYSAKDLTYAGEIAQAYSKELVDAAAGSRDEADLALNIAMVDMKVEAMIRSGHIGEEMSALLRSTRVQSQSIILNAADQRMAYRESTRLTGEAAGSFAAMDRGLFSGIYNAVMGMFNSSGNVSSAIQAGVSFGQAATAKAGAEHPEVLRWGQPMKNYWKNFYTTPETRNRTELDRQIDELLAEIGQSRSAVNSTYQNYVNSWNNFVASLNRADEGFPVWL